MTINYIKDVGFSESKLLLPVFLLLMASFYACNSKKEAVPQTVVSEPDEPQNTAITLYLQPYNGFPEEQILKLRADVQNCLDTLIPEQEFAVFWYENEDLPDYCWYPPRSRYRADSILLYQLRVNDQNYIIGVLNEDISVTSDNIKDWGVLGFGLQPGTSAVVSTFRVKNKSMFYKVVVHEFLHNLGLDHCPQNDRSCYICDADKHPQLEKEVRLCPVCKEYLLSLFE